MDIKTSQEIKDKLLEVAEDLKMRVTNTIVQGKEIASWEWLSYHNALKNVEDALVNLEKISFMQDKIDNPPEIPKLPPKAQKSFMQQIKEINIVGEADWSTRDNYLDPL